MCGPFFEVTGRKYGLGMDPTDWAVKRRVVLDRDGWVCWLCGGELVDGGTSDDVIGQADHVVPRSLGGSDDVGNLAACCRSCNLLKGAFPYSELVRDAVAAIAGWLDDRAVGEGELLLWLWLSLPTGRRRVRRGMFR